MQEQSSNRNNTSEYNGDDRISGAFQIFEALEVPVLVLNEENRVVYFNRAAEKFSGYRRNDVLGSRFFEEMTLPDDSSQYLTHGGVFDENGRLGTKLIRTFHADVERVTFLAWSRGSTILRKDGKKYYVYTARDETGERRLLTEEKRHYSVIQSIYEGVALMDAEWKIFYINPAFERITGYSRSEVIGKRPDVLMESDDDVKFFGSISSALNEGGVWKGETANVRPDGSTYDCEESVTTIDMPDGTNNYVAILRDVTEKNRAEKRIRDALEYTENLVEHAPVGVWIFDVSEMDGTGFEQQELHQRFEALSFELRTSQVNQKLVSILGFDRDEFDHLSMLDPSLVDEDRAMDMIKEIRTLLYGDAVSFETVFHRGEKSIPVLIEAIPLRIVEGKASQVMLMVLDMTERKWMDEQLQKSEEELKWTLRKLFQANQALEENFKRLETISTTDELTGVPNRRKFHDFLGHEWRRAMRKKAPISLVLLDVDYFKYYNDTYGHQGGDDCLKQVARAMSDYMQRTTDLFARYGGEEFVAVLPDTDLEGALIVAERLRAIVENLKLENERSEFKVVTLSIGVATYIPGDDMEEREIIESADQALYQAKQEGRNRAHGVRIVGEGEKYE